jgi:hypothetical protein
MYDLAKSCGNNIFCTYEYLAKNYGTTKNMIEKVVSEARKYGLIEKDSLRFIDIGRFENVPQARREAGFPSMLHIPEVALHHTKLSWEDRKLFALIHYKRNKLDGTLCKTKSVMIEFLNYSKDKYVGKIRKFEKLGLVKKISKNNKHVLKMCYLKPEIEGELDYTDTLKEELSTGVSGRSEGVSGRSERGVSVVSNINNNINNKNKYYDATPLNEKEREQKHDYVPDWKKARPMEAKNTVPEYGSKEFRERNSNLEAEAVSKHRAEQLKTRYIEAHKDNLGDDIILLQKPVCDSKTAFEYMFKKLS